MTEVSNALLDADLITQTYSVALQLKKELNRNKQQYRILMGNVFFVVPVGKGNRILRSWADDKEVIAPIIEVN
jgi:hypothetical protein